MARCQYDIKYPIGWFCPASLAVKIIHILSETGTPHKTNFTEMFLKNSIIVGLDENDTHQDLFLNSPIKSMCDL